MDFLQFETFLAVAEERSFSRAAARLHRTQPAVSQVVKKLEDEAGEVLLDRSSRTVVLTAAGEVLLEYARKMLNLRGEAGFALEELRTLRGGRLDIAANEYTCLYLLPLLHEFQLASPRVKIAVRRSLASRVAEEVLEHTAELGVVSFRPDDPQVRSVVVYRDELALIASPGHALAQRKMATVKELGGENFIAHNVPSPLRQKVVQAFRSRKTELSIGVELPSIDAIKRFVAMGSGVALVPGLTVRSELESGALVRVPVPELQFERKLRLVFRRGANLSHSALAFLKTVEACARKHGDPHYFQAERER